MSGRRKVLVMTFAVLLCGTLLWSAQTKKEITKELWPKERILKAMKDVKKQKADGMITKKRYEDRMKMLKARLYEREQDLKRKAVDQLYGDKGEIAWGSQIRSYVMQPYTMVKDHRTDVQVGNVQGVLDGNLDPFIEAYLKKSRSVD